MELYNTKKIYSCEDDETNNVNKESVAKKLC